MKNSSAIYSLKLDIERSIKYLTSREGKKDFTPRECIQELGFLKMQCDKLLNEYK